MIYITAHNNNDVCIVEATKIMKIFKYICLENIINENIDNANADRNCDITKSTNTGVQ